MTVKQFGVFCLGWALVCALLIEPACVAPYFDGMSGIHLAFGGSLTDLQIGRVETSMDHFRVLCLLYFALPCAVYLVSQVLLDERS